MEKKKRFKDQKPVPKKTEVKFVFDNAETAKHFLGWLCGSGEQEYWNWMEYRESEEGGDITVVDFDYWGGTKKGENFGKGNIICKSGRLNDDEIDKEVEGKVLED